MEKPQVFCDEAIVDVNYLFLLVDHPLKKIGNV